MSQLLPLLLYQVKLYKLQLSAWYQKMAIDVYCVILLIEADRASILSLITVWALLWRGHLVTSRKNLPIAVTMVTPDVNFTVLTLHLL